MLLISQEVTIYPFDRGFNRGGEGIYFHRGRALQDGEEFDR